MINNIKSRYLPLVLIVLFFSCKTSFVPVKAEYEDYRITAQLPKDSSLYFLMQPYRDSVHNTMYEVVGTVATTLEKKQPEGSLGNFMADAMLYAGKKVYNMPIDAAFVNYGGIRINQLTPGPITKGKIFELMPFDNLVILQQIKGDVLQKFLDLTAATGGWPTAGITMQIKNKKAVNVRINGQPLDPDKTYNIINSDFVANGGDNANMLTTIPQINNNYLMRDAIFDYINALKAEGKNISATEENRVTNAQ